jgi:hypothetical protein
MNTRLPFFLSAIVFVVAACSGNSGTSENGASKHSTVIPACTVPPTATVSTCEAQTMVQFCAIPSGSLVDVDGTIITPDGGHVECKDPCTQVEYSLTCSDGGVPSDSLSCRVIPAPTPYGVTTYCCPCS